MSYDVETVPAAATWALRRAVLRPHQDEASQALPDDDDPSTVTFAVRDPDGAVVSTARVARSVLPAALDPPPAPGPVWRLRGMATREDRRHRGIGSAVLGRVIAQVAEGGGGVLWCNARLPALPLYRRAGFAEAGEPWDEPELGPHVVMWRAVAPLSARVPPG